MLIPMRELQAITEGRVTLAFRRWTRPTVRSGGQLRTALGVLAVDAVEVVDETQLTAADASGAGFADVDALRTALSQRGEGTVYRIRLRPLGADPRIGLRNQAGLSAQDVERLTARLRRLDAGSRHGAWTDRTLQAIRDRPGCRAADLALQLGLDKDRLKLDIRKLKELGLTESLEVGYRLSPRGAALLAKAGSLAP